MYLQIFLGTVGASYGWIERWDLFCLALIPTLACLCASITIQALAKGKEDGAGSNIGAMLGGLVVCVIMVWVIGEDLLRIIDLDLSLKCASDDM